MPRPELFGPRGERLNPPVPCGFVAPEDKPSTQAKPAQQPIPAPRTLPRVEGML